MLKFLKSKKKLKNKFMKLNSLYQFICELKEEKGRKLKIICDWDEVLKSRQATVYHIIANRSYSFTDFFQRFWEIVSVEEQRRYLR